MPPVLPQRHGTGYAPMGARLRQWWSAGATEAQRAETLSRAGWRSARRDRVVARTVVQIRTQPHWVSRSHQHRCADKVDGMGTIHGLAHHLGVAREWWYHRRRPGALCEPEVRRQPPSGQSLIRDAAAWLARLRAAVQRSRRGGAKRSHGSHRAGARDVSGAAGGTGSTGHTACQDIGNPSHRTRYHVRRLRRQGWATPRNTAATRRARASVPETPSRRSAATCTAPQAGSKSGKRAPCVFRAQVATHAGRNLPPIPGEGCHACRWKAATAAGCNRPPLQGYWRTRRRSHTPRGIVHLAQPRREAQRPAQRLSMRHVRAV